MRRGSQPRAHDVAHRARGAVTYARGVALDLRRRPGVAAPGPGRTVLLVVVACLGVEALALVVAGACALVDLVRGGRAGADLFLAAFAWGLAALLLAAGRGLLDGRRWARSPAVTWQLFQGVVAVTWLRSAAHPAPVALLVLAVVVVAGLVTPAVVARTTAGRGSTG